MRELDACRDHPQRRGKLGRTVESETLHGGGWGDRTIAGDEGEGSRECRWCAQEQARPYLIHKQRLAVKVEQRVSHPDWKPLPELTYEGFQSPAAGPASGRVSPESHDAIVTISAWS